MKEELEKFLKSRDGEITVRKCIHEMIEKQRKKDEVIKTILSNTDYIKWLIEFTKDKDMVYDNNYHYIDDKLNESNQENINMLSLFFEGIYGYAKKNYIYSFSSSLGEYYQIKINDYGFQIGYISGQGTSFYCRRIPVENNENYIDFMDIINNKKQDKVDYIRNSIDDLSSWIVDLIRMGVPIPAIDEAYDKAMKLINDENKKINDKTLKKKL